MSSIDVLLDLLDRRIVVLDGAMGTMVQGARPRGRGASGAASGSRITRSPLKGCNDLLALTQPAGDRGHPLRSSCAPAPTSSRPTRSPRTSIALADYGLEGVVRDLNVAAAQVRAPRRRPRRARGRPAALGRRLDRPDDEDRVAVARRQRSGRARGHVPPARRRVRRAGARADRGRRRSAAHRDPHRHAQLQGRAVRVRGAVRAAACAACR